MAWHNSDGLYIRFGTEEGTVAPGGEVNVMGPDHITELTLTLTSLTASPAVIHNSLSFPKCRISKVEIITDTAVTSGGSATLDLGFIREDRSTELDYNGLIAAVPIASFNAAGETLALTNGATYAGALIGTTLAYPGTFTANYTTAAFTAGVVKFRIYWYAL